MVCWMRHRTDWPKSDKSGRIRCEFGRTRPTSAARGQNLRDSGPHSADSGRIRLNSSTSGRIRAMFRPRRAKNGPPSTEFEQIRPKLAWIRPELGDFERLLVHAPCSGRAVSVTPLRGGATRRRWPMDRCGRLVRGLRSTPPGLRRASVEDAREAGTAGTATRTGGERPQGTMPAKVGRGSKAPTSSTQTRCAAVNSTQSSGARRTTPKDVAEGAKGGSAQARRAILVLRPHTPSVTRAGPRTKQRDLSMQSAAPQIVSKTL